MLGYLVNRGLILLRLYSAEFTVLSVYNCTRSNKSRLFILNPGSERFIILTGEVSFLLKPCDFNLYRWLFNLKQIISFFNINTRAKRLFLGLTFYKEKHVFILLNGRNYFVLLFLTKMTRTLYWCLKWF